MVTITNITVWLKKKNCNALTLVIFIMLPSAQVFHGEQSSSFDTIAIVKI